MDRYIASYVTQEKFKEFLKTKKPIKNSGTPYLLVEPLREFDIHSFCAHLLIPNGQTSGDRRTENPNNWQYLDDWFSSTNIIVKDFVESKKDGFLTFNGVTFYKILDVRFSAATKRVEIYLRQIINPVYTEQNTGFMIMPFGNPQLNDFYRNSIENYCQEALDIRMTRADNFTDNDVIIDTIYREIEKAEFVICEISECNKNVFYEIGYAKGIEKQLIFIAQRGIENLKFFDVAHIRRIDYDLENPVEFQAKLKDTINTLRAKVNVV